MPHPSRNRRPRLVPYCGEVLSRRPTVAAVLAVLPAMTVTLALAGGASLALAGGSAFMSAAAAEEQASPLARYYTQQLTWQPCRAGECAWLSVPLDYTDPGATGESIRLRVSRNQAKGSTGDRLGSLLVNPGGPGVGGLDYADYLAATLAPEVTGRYDIVGFDTRGVGQSAPITCMSGAQTTRWLRTDSTPDTPREEALLMRRARSMANGCLTRSPAIARHVGSDDTVRDMDILRQALGDDRLTFLGYSYGTYLGTRYAEIFPERVGRFVLDGAVDPSLDIMQASDGQSSGFQQAIGRFAQDCSRRGDCPWPGNRSNVIRGINRILADLDTTPLTVPGRSRLVQSEAITAVFYAMYSPKLWSSLRSAFREARRGDGSGLASLADLASDRVGPQRYATNMASAFPAIACWDSPASPPQAGLAEAARAWSTRAPVPELARAMSWSNAPCSVWFGHSTVSPAPADSDTEAPILIIGGLYDPATPYAWAKALNEQLPTSLLLTYRGDGHTVYGGTSPCIDNAVDAYLINGTLPQFGAACR